LIIIIRLILTCVYLVPKRIEEAAIIQKIIERRNRNRNNEISEDNIDLRIQIENLKKEIEKIKQNVYNKSEVDTKEKILFGLMRKLKNKIEEV
jgi:hypothetical protein